LCYNNDPEDAMIESMPATNQQAVNRNWRKAWPLRVALILVVMAAAWALLAVHPLLAVRPLLAQRVDTAPAASGTPVSANDVNDVARQLWCPLCSGVRLDACELKACAQMKDEIAIMLSEGQDVQLIKDTFVTRYGPQVLGEPPRSGFNWLAWALPFIVLAGGGVYLYTRARAMGREPNPAPAVSATAPTSEYDRKLDAELKQYD
jgi:cytochrome c-type biogenesis protein CcmH